MFDKWQVSWFVLMIHSNKSQEYNTELITKLKIQLSLHIQSAPEIKIVVNYICLKLYIQS